MNHNHGIQWPLSAVIVGLLLVVAPGFAQIDPQARPGQPLIGLTPEQLSRFEAGMVLFNFTLHAEDGLGPIFNQDSCSSCHSVPVGGSGTIFVTRFGEASKFGFDPLAELGGSLLQTEAISPNCAESIPGGANVIAQRITPSILGFGLVEAVDDEDIRTYAENPPGPVSGRVHLVHPLENPPEDPPRVGRFGWKAQVATILTFSGDAALNEMGLTNRLVPQENAPNGNLELLAECDLVPDPEDTADDEGFEFIDRITHFQRYLAPPPQTPRSGMTGESVFTSVGCGSCHVRTYVTRDDVYLEPAIRNKTIHPYSDFLLHDMGALGDGIVQGDAMELEMRTPPLWGLRFRDPMLHDGRAAGGTFEDRVTVAIMEHSGEALVSVNQFEGLSSAQRAQLFAFLGSLGQMEFDHDGDYDVALNDFNALRPCVTGPDVQPYTADDACAVSDVDQDGDVDLYDLSVFQRAFSGNVLFP